MKSINFEILSKKWPVLSNLGAFAEQYAQPDPSSALVKLRTYAETMTHWIYGEFGFPISANPNFYDLLDNDAFKNTIPKVVLDKFHSIRFHGNKAAHGEEAEVQKSLWLLKEAHDLGKWLFISFGGGKAENCPEYREPPKESAEAAKAKQEKKAFLEKLAAQEAKLQELLEKLEAEQAQKTASEKKSSEIESLAQAGINAAEELNFDEKTTRTHLIDSLLTDAGWNVAPNCKSTDEVGQEIEIPYQPTKSGTGYADYVLWDDNGKPLAVVEAKKTSENAEIGRKQASLYADGLEKMYGQHPIIFYTNGFDIWIWDDRQDYPPRRLYGFYSKDSLQYLVKFQRNTKQPLDTIAPSAEIADRLYQLEAIKRVTERFTGRHRKALIVQATGTGKTRVAISLTDVLFQANWVKRVLFLCDRKELRKQAKNAFTDFLSEPLTIVNAGTAKVRDKRIYLATYPAMMKIYQTFDVGFFDLIIADESHRSIYNRYRDIFEYFDCLQVGLTATPVDFINRNTFRLFGCEESSPTFYYSLDRAVEEDYLAPFEVFTHTTQFLREGIRYEDLSDEQRRQLEDGGEDPELFNYESHHVDKQIYNKDTNRSVLRNLMENGIKNTNGQYPGKTIIFARNHRHAILLQELYDEMYPQYGGKFCRVIDNYDPRAEQLIDDLKSNDDPLTVAISVDMLDTGIDIPEIVNLVFAKPVRSKVKFWQMIGRGTRLCIALFGEGSDKKKFRIFDHWGNFDFFDENFTEAEPASPKSLMQRLFEARINLAQNALNKSRNNEFKLAAELIRRDINSLPEESIAVREKWREKRNLSKPEILDSFTRATVAALRSDIAPLMQWINIRSQGDALEFDLVMTEIQTELIRESGRFDNLKNTIVNLINQLQKHLNPVREKAETIRKVQTAKFWNTVTVDDLEGVREELRGIMQYRSRAGYTIPEPIVVDVTDKDVEYGRRPANLQAVDMRAYQIRVEAALNELFESNPTLRKIHAGEAVSENDLRALTSLVLTHHPGVDLYILKEFYRETAMPLDHIIRSVIGMDTEIVKKRFAEFVRRHPRVTAKQTHFLGLLQNHISRHGSIEVERLYEEPFITLDSEGPDSVFPDEDQIEDLIAIIESFRPDKAQPLMQYEMENPKGFENP
ncbi:MAG: DEAD/DEAH box helicase family protein [Desulfobacterales bacterium]|nr:DEAD/DEAH box helicase family protein [Desulfobacterales bacterium]